MVVRNDIWIRRVGWSVLLFAAWLSLVLVTLT